MIVSLAAVLALVAGLAWLARKLRSGGRLKTGLIEIVSGISLGTREKVVLLRVGQEQILVGVSPSGMRTLHVMKDTATAAPFCHVPGAQAMKRRAAALRCWHCRRWHSPSPPCPRWNWSPAAPMARPGR